VTKQEYIAKQRAMTRGVNKRLVCWLIVFFGGLGAMIPFLDYIDQHSEKAWMGNVVGIGLAIFLFGNFVWLAVFAKRQKRQFGVQCRNCSKQIVNSQIAIATGNCGFCGEKLFD
jgi:hypothetical protein